MRSRTSPPGRGKSATGHFLVYSRTKACHTSPEASSDVGGLLVRGAEWSLLPIQIPTARPGADGSFGGARKPYAPKSAAASAVPVFTAAGRRLPPGPLRSSRVLAQIGFWMHVGVAVEDVADEECGLRRHGLRALGLRRRVHGLAVRPRDRQDHPRRDVDTAIREGAECRGELDRLGLDRADRAGQAGLQERIAPVEEAQVHALAPCRRPRHCRPVQGADRGQVQRLLEGLAHADRTALEPVRVLGRPAPEVGRDVEEQAAGRQDPLVERGRVDDRLEGGPRLAGRSAASNCGWKRLLARSVRS